MVSDTKYYILTQQEQLTLLSVLGCHSFRDRPTCATSHCCGVDVLSVLPVTVVVLTSCL